MATISAAGSHRYSHRRLKSLPAQQSKNLRSPTSLTRRGVRRRSCSRRGTKMLQTEELATQLSTRGRQIKFTPERLQQIRNLVERGKSREEPSLDSGCRSISSARPHSISNHTGAPPRAPRREDHPARPTRPGSPAPTRTLLVLLPGLRPICCAQRAMQVDRIRQTLFRLVESAGCLPLRSAARRAPSIDVVCSGTKSRANSTARTLSSSSVFLAASVLEQNSDVHGQSVSSRRR